MLRKQPLYIVLFFSFVINLISCTKPIDGEGIIELMHNTYKDKWYKNLKFEQEAIFYANDTVAYKQIWHEVLKVGEGLAIKFDSINSGSGYVFKNDSMFVYKNNELVGKRKRVHEILELGFNIYGQTVSNTIQKLNSSGLDFSLLEDTEDYYIIGNPDKMKVWIEKERMVFYKIETKNKNGAISKIEFNKYEKLGEGWIAPEVIFYSNNKITLKEIYFNIQLPETLPNNLFHVSDFESTIW